MTAPRLGASPRPASGAISLKAGRLRIVNCHHGVVVDNVNVSVFAYVPVLSASPAPMLCLNVIVTVSFETGPVHDDFENATCSGCGSENAPLVR